MDRVRGEIGCERSDYERYTGAGVGIAILDTGIIMHPDFQSRVLDFRDFTAGRTNPYDDNGHGSHIAGIIAGDGSASFGRYRGVAPNSHLVAVKVLDRRGNGNTADVLRALDFIIANRAVYGLRIVNISIGTVPKAAGGERTELLQAVERAWDAGLIVVVAAGNNGPEPMTVTTPGISRKVITVGSSDDDVEQTFRSSGYKNYSGRGPTPFCIVKPEIVAPGANITSCSNVSGAYCKKSGTSMATAVATGCLAVLLEKYPDMSNRDVKLRLYERCVDLGKPKNWQGWGMVNLNTLL